VSSVCEAIVGLRGRDSWAETLAVRRNNRSTVVIATKMSGDDCLMGANNINKEGQSAREKLNATGRINPAPDACKTLSEFAFINTAYTAIAIDFFSGHYG